VTEAVMRLYTICRNPADLAPGYAVREWRIVAGKREPELGPVLAQGLATLDEARRAVPPPADCPLSPDASDDPCVVETWM
jgi:hypothetical protein